MSLGTIVRYLLGDRGAILEVAACRGAFWVGLALVASASVAREYDSPHVASEPWRLLLPLFASLGAALGLHLLLQIVGMLRWADRPGILSGYEMFVRLFWMTAPLAWLYAIPVERFLSPADAMRANLALLAFVSAWRVALMVRVVSVLYEVHWLAALAVVMLFADSVLLAAIFLAPWPVIDMMSGITESEQVVLDATLFSTAVGLGTWPVWLVLSVAAVALQPWNPAIPNPVGEELTNA